MTATTSTRTVILGHTLTIRVMGDHASVTLTRRAARDCGLHRFDYSDCTPREYETYDQIKRELRSWARRNGRHSISEVCIHTHDGVYLGSVEA